MEFTRKLLRAVQLATLSHDGQRRKGTDAPYAIHPLRVAATVAALEIPDAVAHEHMVLAAVLHDVVEDTAVEHADLVAEFGEEVASIVGELTQDLTLPKPERKRAMLEHLATMSPAAKLVKLADRLDNVGELHGMPRDFVEHYARETRVLLERLAGTNAELEARIRACVG